MVDDSDRKLLTYEAILAELGENLIKARSANEALEALLKNDIGLVLLDVAMPEIDGFQFAEMMRQHPRFRRPLSYSSRPYTLRIWIKSGATSAEQSIILPYPLIPNSCA